MRLRVKDAGESECHPIMGWIEVERKQHHLTRKGADFRRVLLHERVWKMLQEDS